MYRYQATIRGTTPYLFSKYVSTQRVNETGEEHELKTWKERCHTDKDGYLFVPSRAAKNMMVDISSYQGEKIKGQGNKTYKAKFEAGVRYDGLEIPMMDFDGKNRIHIDDVPEGLWAFVPSDGKSGGGKRVWKCFPKIDQWSLNLSFFVMDEIITPEIMTRYLNLAGSFKGLGAWRPGKNGDYGCFYLDSDTVRVSDIDE